MLEGASAELPDETNTGDVAEWRPRGLDPEIPWAREGGYAATSRRPNLVSLVASAAVTTAMIVAIMQAGLVTPMARQPEPVVLNLIALPSSRPAEPPRPAKPKSAELSRENVVRSPIARAASENVVVSVPAPAISQPIIPPARPAAPAPVPEPERAAAAVAAAPSIKAADITTRLLSAPPPRYPIEARRRREQGTVALGVLLATDGSVSEIAIDRSSGSDRLDKAALAAVRRWRWSPTLVAGVPVSVRGVVTIPFVLQR